MNHPAAESIEKSLSNLQAGQPLTRYDISNLSWNFAFNPDRIQFLKEALQYNLKFAEALVVFQRRLLEAAAGTGIESVIDDLTLHYIINTDGLILNDEKADVFDIFDAAKRYAGMFGVGVRKDENNSSILEFNGYDFPCPAWGPEPGKSAAASLRGIGPVINRLRYGRNDVIPPGAFGFNAEADQHTLPNAMVLADFCHLGYFEAVFVEKYLRQCGYDQFQWVDNADSDTQAFIAGKDNHLVVCFRGTSSKKDALVDLNFFKTAAFGGTGRVHRGFQNALNSVWPEIQSAVDTFGPDKKLFFCGHSLGAALAQLAAHRFELSQYPVAAVYVYGSPRVGDRAFKNAYDSLLADRTFLHLNNDDLVTKIPPAIFNFHHLGGPQRVFDRGHLISFPSVPVDLPELQPEELSDSQREEIETSIYDARRAMKAATKFLTASPFEFKGASYSTSFETGAADDHSMDQYLFKFGCAIIDDVWKQMDNDEL